MTVCILHIHRAVVCVCVSLILSVNQWHTGHKYFTGLQRFLREETNKARAALEMAALGPFPLWATRVLARWNGNTRATSNTRNVGFEAAFKTRRDVFLTSAFLSGRTHSNWEERVVPQRGGTGKKCWRKGSRKVRVIGFFLHNVSHRGFQGPPSITLALDESLTVAQLGRMEWCWWNSIPRPRRALCLQRGTVPLAEKLPELPWRSAHFSRSFI